MLERMEYPYQEMKLKQLFKNDDYNYVTLGLECNELNEVYGEKLMFGEIPEDRPYTYSSLVTSIDGKIAYNDAPEGPYISSKNKFANKDSLIDWWTLNLLRASADAIMFGANTLNSEENATGHIYDKNLERARLKEGKPLIPFNIIPTIDGSDIPFRHKEFTCGEIPIIFYTTEAGLDACIRNTKKEVEIIGPYNHNDKIELKGFSLDINKTYIVVTGNKKYPNNQLGLKILRKMGIKKLLVESPTLTHIFMTEKLLDELFLNYSCVYLGGDSLAIGKSCKAFTSDNHPHTKLLSVYMYSPHFMYLRHRVLYD